MITVELGNEPNVPLAPRPAYPPPPQPLPHLSRSRPSPQGGWGGNPLMDLMAVGMAFVWLYFIAVAVFGIVALVAWLT